jgi:anti-sigma B factor antagonist
MTAETSAATEQVHPLSVERPSSESQVAVVALPAEVDLLTSADVRDRLLGSVNRGGVHLIVDAQSTTFFDSSGVHALVRARERATRLGGSVHLVTQSRQLLRVLAITQLDRVIAVVPTLEQAQHCCATPETIHTCRSVETGP